MVLTTHFDHLRQSVRIKSLGEGTFGVVKLYKCKQIHKYTTCNRYFVVKHIKYRQYPESLHKYIDNNDIIRANRDYEIGVSLAHINIRKTLDIDTEFHSIIFENCPGIDLFDYISLYTSKNTRELLKLMNQVMDAVSYLHKANIAHLDIKLENIILNPKTNVLKLIDFGEAVVFKNNNIPIKFYGQRGTLEYISPEVFLSNSFYADKLDLWSCGILFYNLFYNKMPWTM